MEDLAPAVLFTAPGRKSRRSSGGRGPGRLQGHGRRGLSRSERGLLGLTALALAAGPAYLLAEQWLRESPSERPGAPQAAVVAPEVVPSVEPLPEVAAPPVTEAPEVVEVEPVVAFSRDFSSAWRAQTRNGGAEEASALPFVLAEESQRRGGVDFSDITQVGSLPCPERRVDVDLPPVLDWAETVAAGKAQGQGVVVHGLVLLFESPRDARRAEEEWARARPDRGCTSVAGEPVQDGQYVTGRAGRAGVYDLTDSDQPGSSVLFLRYTLRQAGRTLVVLDGYQDLRGGDARDPDSRPLQRALQVLDNQSWRGIKASGLVDAAQVNPFGKPKR